MTPGAFLAAVADIEKDQEGEGYWITVTFENGDRVTGGWRWVDRSTDLIAIEPVVTHSTVYFQVSNIATVRVSE